MPRKKATAASDEPKAKIINIPAPDFQLAEFELIGKTPYMQCRFGEKAKAAMRSKMVAGGTAKKGQAREPKNFDKLYEEAKYKSAQGWDGIPAHAFRAAMISACRVVGFRMTLAKLAVFIEADGEDPRDATPLIKIEGKPEKFEMVTRNATFTPDIRIRPLWRKWNCKLRVRYDAGLFSPTDIANLLMRVGKQVGIGEGRPDSRQSAGLGFGTFELRSQK